ncbi:hypothetical protein SSX86_002666 [Deinandra increscens subsp. villosa]|uniref:DUF4283 domain-containing protein n=1 Tax=Deinandra increscens subsp. villosa TaxID=3103831 RepID=A0AAP0DWV9_9ASTR
MVFVSKKKGKAGSLFAFVKFEEKDVQNKWTLERVLGKIKLRGCILSANIERYDREGKPTRPSPDPGSLPQMTKKPHNVWSRLGVNHHASNSQSVWNRLGDNGVKNLSSDESKGSFLDVVKGDSKCRRLSIPEMEFPAPKKWMKAALVGRAIDMQTLNNLHMKIKDEGFTRCKFRYPGGLQVIITFPDGEEAEVFLECMRYRTDIFSKIDRWEGQKIPYERIAWIHVIGIPPHLWDSSVFIKVGKLFGEVVFVPEVDDLDVNLSWNRLGIVRRCIDPVDESFQVDWGDQNFRCRVTEVTEDWLPDFAWQQPGISNSPTTMDVPPAKLRDDAPCSHAEDELLMGGRSQDNDEALESGTRRRKLVEREDSLDIINNNNSAEKSKNAGSDNFGAEVSSQDSSGPPLTYARLTRC